MIPSLLVVGTPILIADELKSNREFLKESQLSKKERVSKGYCALRSGEADLTSLRSPYSTLGTRFRQQPISLTRIDAARRGTTWASQNELYTSI